MPRFVTVWVRAALGRLESGQGPEMGPRDGLVGNPWCEIMATAKIY